MPGNAIGAPVDAAGVSPNSNRVRAKLMRRLLTRAAVVLAALPAPAAAQQVELTLAEAVRRALEVQPAIVQARGDLRNARAGQRSAVGAFLPTISLGGSSNNASSNRYNWQGRSSRATSYLVSGSSPVRMSLFEGFRRFGSRELLPPHWTRPARVVKERFR